MEIGRYNDLVVKRVSSSGILVGDDSEEIYLPTAEVSDPMRRGDRLRVFVYNSQKGALRATLQKPKGELGEFVVLRVIDVNQYGAFLDWGIPKDLMVPPGAALRTLKVGELALVYISMDSSKRGIIGFTDIDRFISRTPKGLHPGKEVGFLVWRTTKMGVNVIVENRYLGLIYHQDVDRELLPGEKLTGWIRKIRGDGKIDIGLWRQNLEKADLFKQRLLQELEKGGGSLPLTDQSDPQLLRERINMSKRMFKMITGMLLRERKLELHETGITLPGVPPPRGKKILKVKATKDQLSKMAEADT